MPIAEMRRVTVIGHLGEREPVLKTLQKLGAFQAVNLRDAVSPEEWAELFLTDNTGQVGRHSDGSDPEERLAEIKYALEFAQRFNKEKKSLLDQLAGAKHLLSEAEYEEIVRHRQSGQGIYRQCRALDESLAELAARESQLHGQMEALRPWGPLDVPLEDLTGGRLVRILLGMVDTRSAEALIAKLSEEVPDAVATVVGQEAQAAVLLAFHLEDEPAVTAVTRQSGLTPVSFPGVTGTPLQAISVVNAELESIARAKRDQLAKAAELAAAIRVRLYALYDHYMLLREEFEAVARTGETARVFVLDGWVKAKDLRRVEKALVAVSASLVIENRPPFDGEDYPVELENRAIWNPFEAVTKVAGLPKAGTIDPTPYLAPFFFIFFGITLGDAGYGLGLILLSYWLVRRTRAQGMGRQLITLLGVCGVSTFLVGALTGSWFGDLFGIKPLWFDPTKEPLKMLAISMVLGVIHIFWGIGIRLADNVKHGRVWDALFDQGFWLMLLSGLAMWLVAGSLKSAAVLSAGKVLSLVGAVGIVLFAGRSSKNIFARLGSGLYSLYGVSAYMSDVLSYARLLALGLSGSVVAVVFNLLAKMTLSVPVLGILFMLLILAAGHVFNLVISIISSFVHSSRLQYVEFYGKFYEGGGKRFVPLGVNSKYTQVHRTEEA